MKKFLLGFIIGILALACFFYFGGSKYLKAFGSKTEQAGEQLEKYEKKFKKTAKETTEAVRETASGAKEAVETTKEKVKGIVD